MTIEVSTCLNYKKQHEIFHVLSKVGLDRLLKQENALGGYYNDWYHYGKGYWISLGWSQVGLHLLANWKYIIYHFSLNCIVPYIVLFLE